MENKVKLNEWFNAGAYAPIPKFEGKDPSGKNLKEPGTKGDLGKSPVFRGLLDYFPRAVEAVARVSEIGARKYSWKGWETVPDGVSRYTDALARHLTGLSIEGPIDKDTGALHRAQIAWNAMAALELYLRQQAGNKTATEIYNQYYNEAEKQRDSMGKISSYMKGNIGA